MKLPWLEMDVEVGPEDRPWIRKAIEDISTNQLETKSAQRFLKRFDGHHVSFAAPDPEKLDSYERELVYLTPFHRRMDDPGSLIEIALGCESTEHFLPAMWMWDDESVLSQSRIKGSDLHDPATLVSGLTGCRLGNEATTRGDREALWQKLRMMRERSNARHIEGIAVVCRQLLYVTDHIKHVTKPAWRMFPESIETCERLIERHNAVSMRVIGACDESLLLKIQSKHILEPLTLLMRLFSYSAHYSPVAFTWFVDMFWDYVHPSLACVMGEGIESEMDTRRMGVKVSEGEILSSRLPLVQRPTAHFAAQICETAGHLAVAIDREMHRLIETMIVGEA
ncbi:hypothetical protein [Poriferisphaera corsica]|uniref:hypothetical protein n=1 Tax=Poriferisphaera corsica TaxID=2528020 RepID=UPI0011A69911|nr:hypothetical protein [Poriferisphaera corsica]